MNDILGNPSLLVIAGVIAPFVISALKNPRWSDWAKHLLTIGVSLALGLAALALRVEADSARWGVETVMGYSATVLTIAYGVYQFLLKGAGTPAAKLNAKLEGVGTKAGPG